MIPPSSGTSSWQCLHERPCTDPSACADAGVTTCSPVSNGSGMSGGICVDDVLSQIYCCRLDAANVDCPVLAGLPPPTCLAVMGLSGAAGICGYDLALCAGDGGGLAVADLPAVERCYSPPACTTPPAMMSVPYPAGDCDGDCAPNATDPCPCDPDVTCGIPDGGPPDSGLAVDLGAGDSGSSTDLGNATIDLGAPDATTPPMDAGGTAADATAPTPDLGGTVTFRGTGGCNCSVATPADRSAGLLVLLFAAVLPVARRLRKRAR